MKLKVINKNILYCIFPNQKELTFTLSRPQEYYECNSTKLRGQIFSFEKLIDHYMDKNGNLDYFHYWSGFNLPDYVLEDFFKKFELTKREKKLRELIKPFNNNPYYFIATKKGDSSTLKHELVHAHYYLNPVYKQEVNILVKHMDKDIKKMLSLKLKEMGYSSTVMIDEINAYMATSGTKYLQEELDLDINKKDIRPFVDLANRVLRD